MAQQGSSKSKPMPVIAGEKADICQQKEHDSSMEKARAAGNITSATYWEKEALKAAQEGEILEAPVLW